MGAGLNKKAKERLNSSKRDGGTDLNFSECDIADFRNFGPVVAMKALVKLNLAKNQILELPPTIEQLKQLTELDLSGNKLVKLCPQITAFVSLKRFVIAGNMITELPAMGGFRNLTYLDLSNNKCPNLPQDILNTPIAHLNIGGNGMSKVPDLVWEFGGKLKSLWIFGNPIGLRLSDNITRLNGLELLDVSTLQLPQLPMSIYKLTTLKHFYFKGNEIEVLPPDYQKLSNLVLFDGSENRLVSVDKVDIRTFTSLTDINLSNNKLKTLFRGMGGCRVLKSIDVSKNQLEKFPREIGWLDASIRKLNFAYNNLTVLPGEICFLTLSLELDLNFNPQLKYPFREWYQKGTPFLIDNIKPYCSAYPPTSFAKGPELSNTFAGNPTVFMIQACAKDGSNRVTGGDTFTAEITDPTTKNVVFEPVCHDEKNGTYKCFYNCMISGKFEMHVLSEGEEIKGSPYPLTIAPGPTFGPQCVPNDPPKEGKVGAAVTIIVQSKDKFGNARAQGGDKFEATVEGGSKPKATVDDRRDGTYAISFVPGWAGDYEVNIKLGPAKIEGMPLFVAAK